MRLLYVPQQWNIGDFSNVDETVFSTKLLELLKYV